jgi:FAD/FMN-containing dehydrogenase
MSLKSELQSLLSGEVYDDEKSLDQASRDASLFEIRPALVVAPKNSQDIGNLVAYCIQNPTKKLSLTARSGGTDMTGGALTESIVLDMKPHFNSVIKVGHKYAITQPGVYYRDFEKLTLKNDLLMPAYPASREICTMGGMAANNSGGEKTLAYGKSADFITELHMVLRDGKEYVFKPLNLDELNQKLRLTGIEGDIYRKMHALLIKHREKIKAAKPKVSKNSSGYALWDIMTPDTFDLTKLIVGSQGTLGIITQIKFRLIRPNLYSRMLIIFMQDVKPLADVVNAVLPFNPESFESYDNHTLKLAIKYLPELARLIKAKSLIKMGFEFLPEAITVAKMGRLPKLVLMAEFTSNSISEVNKTVHAAEAALSSLPVQTRSTKNRRQSKKYWLIRRESFNLLRHHVRKKHTAPFIDDMIVNPKHLPEFLPQLEAIMNQYNLTYTVAGHIGDGNFHIIPLMNLADPNTPKIIRKLSKEVYDLVLSFDGSLSGEHNDGLIRTPFLEQMYGKEICTLFNEVKTIFDPHAIFNPHKKVHSTLSYALDHFIEDAHAS